MIHINATIKESTIDGAGKGLFAGEFVPKGKLVAFDFDTPTRFMSKSEYMNYLEMYDDAIQHTSPPSEVDLVIRTGVYIFGDTYACAQLEEDLELPTFFINHHEEPNMLHVLGWYISYKDINPGQELFLDYRLWMPPTRKDGSPRPMFTDARNGREVYPLPHRLAIELTTRRLMELADNHYRDDTNNKLQ